MGFTRTAKTSELPPGTVREFQIEGKAVALANVDGKIYAINNTCCIEGDP
jgi:nitrite reductase/ring-hydroxylating ferredoxin subunit